MSGADLLREYLTDSNLSQDDFAARAGVCKGSVSLWLANKAKPTGASALVIQSATGGAVPFASWFGQRKPTRRRPRAA